MTLDRYILRLWSGPFLGGLMIVFVVLVLARALKLMGNHLDNPEASALIISLLILTIPVFLLQIIPVAFFLSMQNTIASLQQSSEMDALRASGISYSRMFRVFFVAGIILWLGLTYSSMVLMPKAQLGFNNILTQIYAMKGSIGFAPQRFTQGLNGITAYVDGQDDTGTYYGVVLEDHRDGESVIYMAKSSRFDKLGEHLVLELTDGVRLEGDGDDQRMLAFKRYKVSIPLPGSHRQIMKSGDHVNMMTIQELWQDLQASQNGLAAAEWNRRLLFPTTLLVLLFFALPLSLTQKRSGKAGSLIAGVLLLVMVFNVQLLLYQQVNQHVLPGWTMWLGQALLLLAGLYLSKRASEDRLPQVFIFISNIRWRFRRTV